MQKYLLLLLFIFSCQFNKNSNQINLVLPGDPKSLDPIYATDVRSGKVCALLYDNLVHYNDSTNIIPGIAKNWTILNFGKKYIFNINKNIIFHDGTKLTAHHIKKSFLRLLDSENLSSYDWIFENVKGVKAYLANKTKDVSGFSVENDYTFIIDLNKQQNAFIYYLAMPPTSIVIKKEKKIIGTGPWILNERIIDGHLLFKKNKNYYNGAPETDKLKIRILPESLPRIAEFLTGYLDIMEIPDNEYKYWTDQKQGNQNLYYTNELNTYYIGLNCSKYPFNNKKIRQAVNYAIDKNIIIDKILNNNARVASGPIPPELLNYENQAQYNYDIEKAKQLLKEANIKEKIQIELWQSKSHKNSLITEIIQSQLKQINIEVKIIRRDWNMFTQAIRENKPDMYYRSWYADYPDAENFLSPLFESEISKKRWNRYKNEEVDRLIKAIENEQDLNKRKIFIKEVNDIIVEDAPWIFLWHTQTAYITNSKIKNWKPAIMYNAEKYKYIKK